MSYLVFTPEGTSPSGKTRIWVVSNSQFNERLGTVRWNAGWRKYWFLSDSAIGLDSGCLGIIKDFIDVAMKRHKEGKD